MSQSSIILRQIELDDSQLSCLFPILIRLREINRRTIIQSTHSSVISCKRTKKPVFDYVFSALMNFLALLVPATTTPTSTNNIHSLSTFRKFNVWKWRFPSKKDFIAYHNDSHRSNWCWSLSSLAWLIIAWSHALSIFQLIWPWEKITHF